MSDVLRSERGPARLDIRHLVIDDVSPHPSTANGIHHVAIRIAREQIAAGDCARILFLRKPGQQSGPAPEGVPSSLLPLEGPKILGHVVGVAAATLDAVTEGAGPETVFHIHTARQPLLLALTRHLERRGFPFAITIHGRYSHVIDRHGHVANWRSALYLGLVERRALEKARFVQAVSVPEAEVIRRLAPNAHIRVVPNAAYSRVLDGVPPPPERELPAGEFPTFGYCGRYEMVHKGLDLLIRGFAIYRAGGGTGRLVLIGTGPQRDDLIRMVSELGVADAAEVRGPQFGEEKDRALRNWHFFVQSSRFDGVPIGALEAALAGLPLIVSRETGLAAQLTAAEGGIVIEDLSPEAVAIALDKARRIGKGGWQAMSGHAYSMAVAIGDWTLITERLRELYAPRIEPSVRRDVAGPSRDIDKEARLAG